MEIELNFKEHYFTSSKYKGGFFTLDNSQDLRKEEIVELEKKGLYNPAIKLPSSPTEGEIETLFPENIAFFRLKSSGRFVFLHSKYTGKTNHSVDRFGNFFTHSLILSEGEPTFPAKFIFDKADFKKSFNLHEDISFTPQLKTDKIIRFENSDFTSEELFRFFQTFILAEPKRINLLAKVFDLIAEGKIAKPGYNITICDKKINLNDLLLSINYFLPRNIANKISFASYVDNPDSANYPFEITGIIPECGIEKLPEQYFNLVDSIKHADYFACQPYTKLLMEIISSGNYSNWKNLLKEVEEFEIDELNQKINAPALFVDFKNNIQHKTMEDFNALLLLNLSKNKEIQVKHFFLEKRPDIYLDFIRTELRKEVLKSYNLKGKLEAFGKLYVEHFAENETFRTTLLSQFVESFRDELSSDEKIAASVHVLTISNCLNVSPKSWVSEKMEEADLWFENESIDIENKLDALQSLNKKYSLQDFENLIPNIMKVKALDNLITGAKNGNLLKHVDKYKSVLKSLKDSERQTVFVLALNNENLKGQFDHKNFSKYIKMIKEYFENEGDFWYTYFKNNKGANSSNNDFKKHSLEYLMKCFIVSNFKNEEYRFELIEKLLPLDDYSRRWIEEEIRETSNKESVFIAFKDYLNTVSNTQKSSSSFGWNIFKTKSDDYDNKVDNSTNNYQRLQEVSGLAETVKIQLKQHLELIQMAKENRLRIQDLAFHFVFPGLSVQAEESAGRILSKILHEKGFLDNGKFFEPSRNELIGNYPAHTKQKTTSICEAAKGSVLFIKDAASLFTDSNNENGRESFLTLLKEIEINNYGECIIFSGCSIEMKALIDKTPAIKLKINFI